jgi:hypothetical protein
MAASHYFAGYLDTSSLRARLMSTTTVTYDEVTDPGRESPTLARFCCEECKCAILGVPARAFDDSPTLASTAAGRMALDRLLGVAATV